jgi:hypothetical protein
MRYVSDLIAVLKQRRAEIGESIADGNAGSIETYNLLVGQRQGLGMALDIIDDLLKEDEKDER